VTGKYRDDHARNGLLRCKAFTMKDAYSVHADAASLDRTYDRVRGAYLDVFDDIGLDVTVVAADNEVMGGHASEEFVAPVDDGSDDLVYCTGEDCRFGRTDESTDFEAFACDDDCPDCGRRLAASDGTEVGHVFKLGTRYAEALEFTVDGPDGGRIHPAMGSYGIGVTRVLQTLLQQARGRERTGGTSGHTTESSGETTDVDGCRWPVTDWGTVAPYRAAIVPLDYTDEHRETADELHAACGREETLLFDDPAQSIGERFAECDLLGVPAVVVLGNHYTETGEVEVEYADGRTEFVDPERVPGAVGEFGGRTGR
jgi:prolyl-tRNA synthetase